MDNPLIPLDSRRHNDFIRALFYASQVKQLKRDKEEANNKINILEDTLKKRNKEIENLCNLIEKEPTKRQILIYKKLLQRTEERIIKYKNSIATLKSKLNGS